MTIDENEFNVHQVKVITSGHELMQVMDGDSFKNYTKEKLIRQLIQHLLSKDQIDFTVQDDPSGFGKIFRARIVSIPRNTIIKLRKDGAFKNKEI